MANPKSIIFTPRKNRGPAEYRGSQKGEVAPIRIASFVDCDTPFDMTTKEHDFRSVIGDWTIRPEDQLPGLMKGRIDPREAMQYLRADQEDALGDNPSRGMMPEGGEFHEWLKGADLQLLPVQMLPWFLENPKELPATWQRGKTVFWTIFRSSIKNKCVLYLDGQHGAPGGLSWGFVRPEGVSWHLMTAVHRKGQK